MPTGDGRENALFEKSCVVFLLIALFCAAPDLIRSMDGRMTDVIMHGIRKIS